MTLNFPTQLALASIAEETFHGSSLSKCIVSAESPQHRWNKCLFRYARFAWAEKEIISRLKTIIRCLTRFYCNLIQSNPKLFKWGCDHIKTPSASWIITLNKLFHRKETQPGRQRHIQAWIQLFKNAGQMPSMSVLRGGRGVIYKKKDLPYGLPRVCIV